MLLKNNFKPKQLKYEFSFVKLVKNLDFFCRLLYNIVKGKVNTMAEQVREPQQQRSIDKKRRIIEAGYRLFAKQGYFNTNTAEIAKEAKVSTGIVYGYFRDKRDIMLEVLDIYVENVYRPVFAEFETLTAPISFETLVPEIIDKAVEAHEKNEEIHQALYSLTPTDKAVNDKFMELERQVTLRIVKALRDCDYDSDCLTEKVHFTMEMIQSFAHEAVFDKHEYIDYAKMRSIVIGLVLGLFK